MAYQSDFEGCISNRYYGFIIPKEVTLYQSFPVDDDNIFNNIFNNNDDDCDYSGEGNNEDSQGRYIYSVTMHSYLL